MIDWPLGARLAGVAAYFAALNGMIFAPASVFRKVGAYIAFQDKIAHVALFMALACLTRWALPVPAPGERPGAGLRYAVPLALATYACATEFLQPLIGGKGRMFDWFDMAGNAAGLCLGWVLFDGVIAAPVKLDSRGAGA